MSVPVLSSGNWKTCWLFPLKPLSRHSSLNCVRLITLIPRVRCADHRPEEAEKQFTVWLLSVCLSNSVCLATANRRLTINWKDPWGRMEYVAAIPTFQACFFPTNLSYLTPYKYWKKMQDLSRFDHLHLSFSSNSTVVIQASSSLPQAAEFMKLCIEKSHTKVNFVF